MSHPIRRILTLMLVLAALTPASILAQTPEPPASDLPEVTIIGAFEVKTDPIATPADGEPAELVHALVRLVIDPGDTMPTLWGILHVQQGTVRVTASEESARIRAGTRAPIPYGIDEAGACDAEQCSLAPGQSAVLGPGNSISATGGGLDVEVIGDERVIIHMSMLVPASDPGERCWICPEL